MVREVYGGQYGTVLRKVSRLATLSKIIVISPSKTATKPNRPCACPGWLHTYPERG